MIFRDILSKGGTLETLRFNKDQDICIALDTIQKKSEPDMIMYREK